MVEILGSYARPQNTTASIDPQRYKEWLVEVRLETSGLLEFEQEEKMLLRLHLGKASLWSVPQSPTTLVN